MQLCIDIGNSAIKTAVFSGNEIVGKNVLPDFGIREIEDLGNKYPEIQNVILCSVRADDPALIKILKSNFRNLLVLDSETAIPFENLYESKNTLGKDRLAAITGANNIFPDRNVLVVDAGSAITYDIIDNCGRYLGGNISPGLFMRFRALHEFTGKLPLISPKEDTELMARNTEDSIAFGVVNGAVFEMQSYINKIKTKFRDPEIIFTGGDANYFVKKLKNTIFVDPELVLKGLNRILTYNVEEK